MLRTSKRQDVIKRHQNARFELCFHCHDGTDSDSAVCSKGSTNSSLVLVWWRPGWRIVHLVAPLLSTVVRRLGRLHIAALLARSVVVVLWWCTVVVVFLWWRCAVLLWWGALVVVVFVLSSYRHPPCPIEGLHAFAMAAAGHSAMRVSGWKK
jgi:hypothetical protein